VLNVKRKTELLRHESEVSNCLFAPNTILHPPTSNSVWSTSAMAETIFTAGADFPFSMWLICARVYL